MNPRARPAAAHMVALGLLAGCAGPAPQAGSPPPPIPTAVVAVDAPAYVGPSLPGLESSPVWSVPGARLSVAAVGDAFAVVAPLPTEEGDAAVDGKPSTIEFRDAATGQLRSTVSSPIAESWVGTWRGEPAFYVAFQTVQVSDGLSAERRAQVVTAFGSDGTTLGSVSRPLDANLFAVVNGWVVTRSADERDAATVADPDGSVRTTQRCSRIVCAIDIDLDSAHLVEGSNRIPIVLGDLAFGAEGIDNRDRINPLRIVATDLTTGQQTWTSSTVERPPGAVAEQQVTGAHGTPIQMIGDRLLMAWYTDDGTGFGDRGEVLGLHDPSTGRLLLPGPEIGTGFGSVLLDATDTVAIVADAPSDPHSLAWDLQTGQELWRQAPEENLLVPVAILGEVLIGNRRTSLGGGSSDPIFLELRTKAVLDDDPDEVRWPVVADTGHAATTVTEFSDDTSNGIFVFAPAR